MGKSAKDKQTIPVMRYVPDLIPASSRVLPDYFKGNIYQPAKQNVLKDICLWILGILFFLFALVNIMHPLLFVLQGLCGFMLIPPGHRFCEKQLRFKLTPTIKTIVVLGLFIGSLPLGIYYSATDRQETQVQQLLNDKAAKEKVITDRAEQQRTDSFNFYLQQSRQLEQEHKVDESARQLQYALALAKTPADNEEIAKERTALAALNSIDLVKAGKYKAALPVIDSLIDSGSANTKLLYNRALCYSKTGKIQQAVGDLKVLLEAGNRDAEKLNNKINPIRKRIVGYETLCCDGTTSDARGRGACSHHGGVCDWNHPIYEASRKYE